MFFELPYEYIHYLVDPLKCYHSCYENITTRCFDNVLGYNGSEEFIKDDFNATGLEKVVSDQAALRRRMTAPCAEIPNDEALSESSIVVLYGLLHARFILTTKGLHLMLL
eukprot:Filipodium_phascolosomae@DN2332_c0_g1_i3.p1